MWYESRTTVVMGTVHRGVESGALPAKTPAYLLLVPLLAFLVQALFPAAAGAADTWPAFPLTDNT